MLDFTITKQTAIQNIFNAGLTIKGKYIYKATQSGNPKEVAGILNEKTIHFYALNLPNGIEGKNYTYNQFNALFSGNTTISKDYSTYINAAAETIIKKKMRFDDFDALTNVHDHKFSIQKLIDTFHTLDKRYISLPKKWNNSAGIKALKGFTLFPIFDLNNTFVTAQMISYKSDYKRNKDKYISWLHSNFEFKKYLGITTKIAPEQDICFYREHLVDLDKTTIIVEAPKTAELGALILPMYNWIATIGVTRFKNLDTTFLDNKNTYVLPDNDAVKEWSTIADAKGFKTIHALFENTKHLEGFEKADFADLIIPYLSQTSDDLDNAFKVVYSAILSILNNDIDDDFPIDKNITDAAKSLFFEVNKKKVKPYFKSCIPFYVQENAIVRYSNAAGTFIKTNDFKIYQENFNVLSPSWNINKDLSEIQFINNLKKTFLVVKWLNRENDYLRILDIIVSNIKLNGAYNFNSYGIENLFKQFDKLPIEDAIKYTKNRNYQFEGSSERFDNYQFLDKLRKAQLIYKTYSQLYAIKKVVHLGIKDLKFIDKKEVGIKRKTDNIYISNLIDRFNIASIGTDNTRTAKLYLEVNNKIAPQIAHYNSIIYYTAQIGVQKYNITEIAAASGASRNNISAFLKVKKDVETIKSIYSEICYYLNNLDKFTFQKVEGEKYNIVQSNILDFKDYQEPCASEITQRLPLMSCKDAFADPIDFTHSVLNMDPAAAVVQGSDFLLSWYLFNNRSEINKADRINLKMQQHTSTDFIKFAHQYDPMRFKWCDATRDVYNKYYHLIDNSAMYKNAPYMVVI